jgi:23S rRNA pseudouridine955/2504/2580 synthase
MTSVNYLTISVNDDGQRLDNFLFKHLKGVPKSHVYRIIRGGEVRINKKRAKANTRIQEGDIIRIPPIRLSDKPVPQANSKLAAMLKASILFENDSLLVINKPSGIAVHGGSGVSLGVIEIIRSVRAENSYYELVHRLDRETSGCLLIAKKKSVLKELQQQLEQKTMQKHYWALLANRWSGPESREVEANLLKNSLKSGERMVVVNPQGKSAKTVFKLIKNFENSCLVEASPITGRTHQIRVHAASINHPIIGDSKYGSTRFNRKFKELGCNRLFLHAKRLQFCLNNRDYSFEAPLGDSLREFIQQ